MSGYKILLMLAIERIIKWKHSYGCSGMTTGDELGHTEAVRFAEYRIQKESTITLA